MIKMGKTKIFIVFGMIFLLLITNFTNLSALKIEGEKDLIQIKNIENTANDEDIALFNLEKKDAIGLSIEGIDDKPESFYKDKIVITKSLSFNELKCTIENQIQGKKYINLEGTEPYISDGKPIVPKKDIKMTIPKNSKVLSVHFTDVFYRDLKGKVTLTTSPKPIFLIDKIKDLSDLENKIDSYLSDNYYPGKILDYYIGEDNTKKNIFVQIYPLQNIPKTGETIIITEGKLKIVYEETSKLNNVSNSSIENIIITDSQLYKQAFELKKFHDNQSITTKVVNASWIYENYSEASNPPYTGYKNTSLIDKVQWKGVYNYSKAKKIISYLNDSANHSNLKYVTIFGNARLIPPSYYYFQDIYPIKHYCWVPTDIFYSSPDYDLLPNYNIGRLPVNSISEAEHVVNKIKNWNGTEDMFEKAILSSGKVADTPFFVGELTVLETLKKGFLNGVNVEKQFETDGQFTKNNLLNSLRGGNGLVFNFAHGTGDVISFGDDILNPSKIYLTSNEILALPESDKTPVVISGSCSNAAFDTSIMGNILYKSIGESVLLSDAGGIAYIGASRLASIAPVLNVKNGVLEFNKSAYMGDLLTYLFKAYSEGENKLGNLSRRAVESFIQESDLNDDMNLYNIFSFTMLGDPALEIPNHPNGSSVEGPVQKALNPIDYRRLDVNGSIPIYAMDELVNVKCHSNHPTLTFKIVDSLKKRTIGYLFQIKTIDTVNNNATCNFYPDSSTLYFIKAIDEHDKESRFYLWTFRVVDDDFNVLTPGYGTSRWSKIQDAIDNSNRDEGIFVFNGIYNENIIVDKPLSLIGENRSMTIIDGGRTSNVVEFLRDSSAISSFTIRRSGIRKDYSGINIKASDVTVTDCEIKDNRYGIYIHDGGKNLFGNKVQISYNIIDNNQYGIYQEDNGFRLKQIIANYIVNNVFGIYLAKSRSNLILTNSFIDNRFALHLHKTHLSLISLNDFIKNTINANFVKSSRNLWYGNYWDNWIGLKYPKTENIPKYIFGRNGLIIGIIPTVDRDRTPAKIRVALAEDYFI